MYKELFTSRTYQDILTKLEMHVLHSEDFQTFEVNGVDVFVVLDFVYKDVSQEKWIVVDWKTGKESEDDRKQLAFMPFFYQNNTIFQLKISSFAMNICYQANTRNIN